ncbi:PRA1 family protein B4-like [Senna tora]|uniref:PRA1 family protein n=1 Tax=Senna tora TaxID=362788 RepID=A0A835CK35_9FABA|nr:PRA1 family protein B4-like [Senna tora]
MASSARPVLPITSPKSAGVVAVAGAGVEPQPALRAFVSNLSDSVRHGFSQRRPWSELVDRSAFSKPTTFAEATFRIRKNFSYFRINYYALTALALAISLISNPFSLFVLIGLIASWIFLYFFRPSDQPLVLFGRVFTDFETLVLLGVLTVFVLFLTSVGSILVSALMAGVAVVCIHGALRVPEDLFMDEQEAQQSNGCTIKALHCERSSIPL